MGHLSEFQGILRGYVGMYWDYVEVYRDLCRVMYSVIVQGCKGVGQCNSNLREQFYNSTGTQVEVYVGSFVCGCFSKCRVIVM